MYHFYELFRRKRERNRLRFLKTIAGSRFLYLVISIMRVASEQVLERVMADLWRC